MRSCLKMLRISEWRLYVALTEKRTEQSRALNTPALSAQVADLVFSFWNHQRASLPLSNGFLILHLSLEWRWAEFLRTGLDRAPKETLATSNKEINGINQRELNEITNVEVLIRMSESGVFLGRYPFGWRVEPGWLKFLRAAMPILQLPLLFLRTPDLPPSGSHFGCNSSL